MKILNESMTPREWQLFYSMCKFYGFTKLSEIRSLIEQRYPNDTPLQAIFNYARDNGFEFDMRKDNMSKR